MNFPLQRNNGRPNISLSSGQIQALSEIREKISRGAYKLVPNRCLCGNEDPSKDIVITEKDRFGLPFSFKLCQACSLVRTDPILDESSLRHFYAQLFARLHRPDGMSDAYFGRLLSQGRVFLNVIKGLSLLDSIENVLEVGCSAGGNLLPFKEAGKRVQGFDFDPVYLEYGRSLGLDLVQGDFKQHVEDNSQDLIILSHVLEHLSSPWQMMVDVIRKVKPGKFMLVEVPGILHIHRSYYCPTKYFQNDHIFYYHRAYLEIFFEKLDLEIVSGNEICRFVLRKPEHWRQHDAQPLLDSRLNDLPNRVERYLKRTFLINRYFPYRRMRGMTARFCHRMGIMK